MPAPNGAGASQRGVGVMKRVTSISKRASVALLVCALGALGVGLAGTSGADSSTKVTAGAPEAVDNSAPTPAEISTIRATAIQRAAAAGEPAPSIEMTTTSMGQARALIDPQATGQQVTDPRTGAPWSDTSVYVVSMRGRFTFSQAHLPHGALAPIGTVMDLLIDRTSNTTVGIHIGSESKDLHQLNSTVTKLG